jgi:hypothetical protein
MSVEEYEDWERLPSIPRPVHSSETPEHRVLREVFRHYTEFREYVAQGNNPVLEHTYLVPITGVPGQCPENPKANKEHEALEMACVYCGGPMRRVTVSFNFWDLHRGLKDLAPRKREALFYNVILDQKQKDVAKTMTITTVTVGQYVEHAFRQLISSHIIEVRDAD